MGWLAQVEPYTHRVPTDTNATVIALDRGVANGFQFGVQPGTGPFLSYPPALWWFLQIWRAAPRPARRDLRYRSATPALRTTRPVWSL